MLIFRGVPIQNQKAIKKKDPKNPGPPLWIEIGLGSRKTPFTHPQENRNRWEIPEFLGYIYI